MVDCRSLIDTSGIEQVTSQLSLVLTRLKDTLGTLRKPVKLCCNPLYTSFSITFPETSITHVIELNDLFPLIETISKHFDMTKLSVIHNGVRSSVQFRKNDNDTIVSSLVSEIVESETDSYVQFRFKSSCQIMNSDDLSHIILALGSPIILDLDDKWFLEQRYSRNIPCFMTTFKELKEFGLGGIAMHRLSRRPQIFYNGLLGHYSKDFISKYASNITSYTQSHTVFFIENKRICENLDSDTHPFRTIFSMLGDLDSNIVKYHVRNLNGRVSSTRTSILRFLEKLIVSAKSVLFVYDSTISQKIAKKLVDMISLYYHNHKFGTTAYLIDQAEFSKFKEVLLKYEDFAHVVTDYIEKYQVIRLSKSSPFIQALSTYIKDLIPVEIDNKRTYLTLDQIINLIETWIQNKELVIFKNLSGSRILLDSYSITSTIPYHTIKFKSTRNKVFKQLTKRYGKLINGLYEISKYVVSSNIELPKQKYDYFKQHYPEALNLFETYFPVLLTNTLESLKVNDYNAYVTLSHVFKSIEASDDTSLYYFLSKNVNLRLLKAFNRKQIERTLIPLFRRHGIDYQLNPD